jgi:hypothetical protein
VQPYWGIATQWLVFIATAWLTANLILGHSHPVGVTLPLTGLLPASCGGIATQQWVTLPLPYWPPGILPASYWGIATHWLTSPLTGLLSAPYWGIATQWVTSPLTYWLPARLIPGHNHPVANIANCVLGGLLLAPDWGIVAQLVTSPLKLAYCQPCYGIAIQWVTSTLTGLLPAPYGA